MVYTTESMNRAIKQAKKNIATFEEAIEKERATIKQAREWMDKIEEQERLKKEAQDSVQVEVVRE